MTHHAVFDGIYAAQGWGPGSGPGSTPASVAPYIDLLHEVVAIVKPARVLDLGCGFHAPYAGVDWQGADYLGLDAAERCIEANKSLETERRHFAVYDWLNAEPLPNADLVLVKDVLQHWRRDEISLGLKKLSRFSAVLVTNSVILGTSEVNAPLAETGHCAPLNLLLPPWSLPRPSVFKTWVAVDNSETDVKLALLFSGADLARAAS